MIINTREKTTCEERLKSLGLWTLEERRNRQDIVEVFKMYRGYSSVALQELHRESKKGATLIIAITLSILGGFAKVAKI